MRIPTARDGRPEPRWQRGALLGLAFLLGVLVHQYGLLSTVGDAVGAAQQRAEVASVRADLPPAERPRRLDLDVGHMELQRLEFLRKRAIQRGWIEPEDKEELPATLRSADGEASVKIRLKGDLLDHLVGPRSSLRVKVRGGETVFGMKHFALNVPASRNFACEWLYQRAMDDEDVLALRFEYVDVYLNGEPLGLFALEEGFDKHLIEHRERREGPIVRFDESGFWHANTTMVQADQQPIQLNRDGEFMAAEVDVFHSGRTWSNEALRPLAERAVALLEAFRRGDRSAAEVFDVDRMGRFLAVSDAFGAEHATRWHNVRFYFDPLADRLEPIAFDGCSGTGVIQAPLLTNLAAGDRQRPLDWYRFGSSRLWYERLMADPALVRAYVGHLERVSEAPWREALLAEHGEGLTRANRLLEVEFGPQIDRAALLAWNQQVAGKALQTEGALHAHVAQRNEAGWRLQVGNAQLAPLEVVSARQGEQEYTLAAEAPPVLPGRAYHGPVAFTSVELVGPPPTQEPLVLRYRVVGASALREHAVSTTPWTGGRADDGRPATDLAALEEHPAFAVDHDGREIRLLPGTWRLDATHAVPEGFTVVAGPATELVLGPGASLISRSPLRWAGTDEAPVVIRGEPDAGGLFVTGATDESTLTHVRFVGLGAPRTAAWRPTGAVTFHESPVRIEGCEFHQARAEDALNVVRSTFDLRRSRFHTTASDALDADFCDGELESVGFVGCGNDCLDVSGSSIRAADLEMAGVGDKGLSAGEHSEVRVDGIRVRDAHVGLASKDRSTLWALNVLVADSANGFAAYQKKPEFGPASIHAASVRLEGVAKPWRLEQGSTAELDGQTREGAESDLADALIPPTEAAP
ncbi:MAG: hypothetical protein GY898_25980 [Proteobacteria bacterium]|nr:hypothetical protein [Pseudomonadota bacterium]